ncbi:FAD:protein FMN transferase [Alicyclobacillus macrosporangiidus]|uniref:FAD:protein FMN transferase n=1 Tax=Alicyclobacillus macrosporangiidus TaxID=392015 RepID=UPI000496DB9F|nr:FAD:protein FMN transferase [Alicyclobacillus macrosporangiidus]
MSHVTFQAMGTQVEIVIPQGLSASANVGHAVQRARNTVGQLEALLSRFRPDSDVSRVNSAPGRWVPVHPATVEVLRLARQSFEHTKGLFNPCLGHVLENIGYDVSFHRIADQPVVRVTDDASPFVAPLVCPFEIDAVKAEVLLYPGYKIDLGGIAKGWIVQQAALILRQQGISQFLFNAGGDMICCGTNGHRPWCVAIADPYGSHGSHVITLDVSDVAVATSGTYRRRWTQDGKTVHHILDPFLGVPVESDVVSCTVIHQDLVQAEVMAKVGLLLGSERGRRWLADESLAGWVLVLNTGEVIHAWNS